MITWGLPQLLRWWRIHLQCKRLGFDPWIWTIPCRREQQPTPVFLPGESHGQWSLAGWHWWESRETLRQMTTALSSGPDTDMQPSQTLPLRRVSRPCSWVSSDDKHWLKQTDIKGEKCQKPQERFKQGAEGFEESAMHPAGEIRRPSWKKGPLIWFWKVLQNF